MVTCTGRLLILPPWWCLVALVLVGEAHVEVNGSQVEGERVCGPEGVTLTSLSMPPCHDTAEIIFKKSHL